MFRFSPCLSSCCCYGAINERENVTSSVSIFQLKLNSQLPLRPASLRPHLRRTHQPPLAPGSGESAVQDGRAHVQGHSWNCAVIPESTGSCRRSAWSTFPPLCSDQSSACAVRETVYRRRPGLPGRRTRHLEQLIAKYHYTDPTGPARTFFAAKLRWVRAGRRQSPRGSGRVRVVEFSSYRTA